MEQIAAPITGAESARPSLALFPPLELDLRAALRDAFRLFVGVVAIPNAAFAIAGRFWDVPHPLLNLDYAWLALAFPFLRSGSTAFLGGLLVLLDLLVTGTIRFQGNPLLVFDALPEIRELPARFVVPIALLLLTAAALYALVVWRFTRKMSRRLGPNVIVAVASLGLAFTANAFRNRTPVATWNHSVVLGEVLPVVVVSEIGIATTNHGIEEERIPSATAPLFEKLASGAPLPRNIVVALVESFGHAHDATFDDALLAPLEAPAIRERYHLERGIVPSHDITVQGELRELCHALVLTGDLYPDELQMRDCLPHLLARRGYRTLGLHGFTKQFFHRYDWWPVLGLRETRFDEELKPMFPDRRCGQAYEGVCDSDVLQYLAGRLRQARDPLFVHWMTLNGHNPVTPPETNESRFDCESHPLTSRSTEICALAKRHEIVLRGLAEVALDSTIDNTLFVIVGDHVPRLSRVEDLAAFHPDSAPFIVLWPTDTDTERR